MSYLEQSTRYIAYDARLGGRYRFYRDPAVLASRLGTRYVGDMDRMFDAYSQVLGKRSPSTCGRPSSATRRRQRLRVPPGHAGQGARRDAAGMLPAASLSNVGIYGTGQAFEALLLRLRAHPLPEARDYGELMLARAAQGDPELPAPGRPRRARRALERLPGRPPASAPPTSSTRCSRDETPTPRRPVTLVDWDPDAEDKLLAAICYPHSDLPEHQLLDRVRTLGADERLALRARLRRRAGEPAPQAGPGVRARRLPLRRALRLRRLPRPAAAPHAHDRVAAADARTTATCAPSSSTRPARPALFDEAMHRSARLYDALHRRLPRAGRRTRWRWRTACAT